MLRCRVAEESRAASPKLVSTESVRELGERFEIDLCGQIGFAGSFEQFGMMSGDEQDAPKPVSA